MRCHMVKNDIEAQNREPEGEGRDERAEREQWFLASRRDADRRVLTRIFSEGSRQRRRLEIRREPPGPPPQPPGGVGAVNWTPLGPTVVAHGQASGNPPVSGRITSLVAGPMGSRVYAGAANGGVWFTSDGGATWGPLDDYA